MAVRHLTNSQFWSPRESAEVFRLDIKKLTSPWSGPRIAAVEATKHPLEKIASWLSEHQAFHRKALRPEAGLEAQYELLDVLHRTMTDPSDRTVIRKALQTAQAAHRSFPWWARGQALLADFIGETTRPGRLIEVREEALKGMTAFPNSIGGKLCAVIVHRIERPDYSLISMSNDGLSKRSLLLNYKNIKKMYFRAYAVDVEKLLQGKRNGGDIYNVQEVREEVQQGRSKPVREWSVDLLPTPDFAHHRKFITPDLKAAGAYLIVSSTRADFSGSSDVVQASRLLVSDLVIASVSLGDGTIDTKVLSGEKGTAVQGATISLYRFKWASAPVKVESKTTNALGGAVFQEPRKTDSEYWNYFLVAKKDAAVSFELDRIYFGKTPETTRVLSSFVYTDRSVYRPTQKLFWKVAAYSGNPSTAKFATVVKDTTLTVQLYDANSEVVDTRKVKVGEFGTASGEFTVPAGRALGNWSLQVAGPHSGSAQVKVEEYKRPTFETKLKEVASAVRLNRVVKIDGEANYYFGLPVSNGKVTWRVTRAEVAPPWWMWRGWLGGSAKPPETIASGSSELKSDGSYSFDFTPAADERKSADGTSYQFAVEANVTDEGGETRQATRNFRLGFVAVEAELKFATGYFKAGAPVNIATELKNLDGQGRAGSAKYRIVKLKQPLTASLPADLPRDTNAVAYGYEGSSDESDLEKHGTPDDRKRARWETAFNWLALTEAWSDADEVAAGDLSHDTKGAADIKIKSLDSGVYRLRYETKDEFGATYKVSRPFIVADKKSPVSIALLVLAEKTELEVGQTARLYLQSGLAGQQLQIETFRAGRRISTRTWTAGVDSTLIEFPIKAEDRGGFSVAVSGLRDFQSLREEVSFLVPWTDRTLNLEFSTFRDSLRPGAKETFRVTAKDSAGKSLARGTAEILGYMYDRSLDIFGGHFPPSVSNLYPVRTGAVPWNFTLGSHPALYWVGSFPTGPVAPALNEDELRFPSTYGIGGPGQRRFGGFEGISMDSDMAMAEMAPQMAAPMKSGRMSAKSMNSLSDKRASIKMEGAGGRGLPEAPAPTASAGSSAEPAVQVRSNFSETAFFIPHLITNAEGAVSFEFNVPDSVTSWNVYAHALTKDLRGGSILKTTKSVKDLMVRTYAPRFLRAGDSAEVKVTVSNASDAGLKGELVFDIENVETGKSAASEFALKSRILKVPFSVAKKGTWSTGFNVKAPAAASVYAFKAIAKSGAVSDGERKAFPILPSRMQLAQSRFAALKNTDRKVLEFKDLAAGDDPTLKSEKLVVTVDAQLFYGVLQALPYLVEYPYECVEQTLNRFLSTGIVSSVFKKYPAVATMAKEMSTRKTQFEAFAEPDANRRMTLEESPWLEAAKGGRNEEKSLLNILDQRVAKEERTRALDRLKKMQLPNGAFPWFQGGPADNYMTIYVLMGLGRALEYQVEIPKPEVVKAWTFVKSWLRDNLDRMMTEKCCSETITMISYAVSLYPDASWTDGEFDESYRKKLLDYSFKNWKQQAPLIKGYLALALKRMNRAEEAKLVWDSVMDSAKTDAELGTYWAQEDRSWLWYNDTVETHAFSLRAMMELNPVDPRNEGLVQWLFLNKKLNHWKSTRATAEAIYSLVRYLDQTKTLGVREAVSVSVGPEKTEFVFDPLKYTGKKNQFVVPAEKVTAASAKTVVEKKTPGLAFASATWHFSTDRLPKEDRSDFFVVSRKYFKRELAATAGGGKEWTLKPLVAGEKLRVGDQIEVQLSLRSKHAAEYVHLRDPRAAGLEPEGLVSAHKWELGIGWYEEIRDSGSNFFFTRLPVGEYNFRYRLRANMAGTFRVSPATVQSMYAPEFNAYSAGNEMKIEPAAK